MFVQSTSSAGPITITYNTYDNISFTDGDLLIKGDTKETTPTKPKYHTPKVLFRFVKGKFTILEKQKVKANLIKLRKLMEDAEILEQHGLKERCMREYVIAAKIQVLQAVLGQARSIKEEEITKILPKISADRQKLNKCVFFEKWENFPRPVPENVRTLVMLCLNKKLFDGYKVLYLDYTKDPVAKSTADKVREKDPILFGYFKEDPSTLYFIVDWIDEVCDLSFNEMLATIKEKDIEDVDPLENDVVVDEEYVKQLQKRLSEYQVVIQNATIRNFRQSEQELRIKEESKSKELRNSLYTHGSKIKEKTKQTYLRIKEWFKNLRK